MVFDRKPPNPDGHSEWIVHAPTMSKVFNAPGYPQPVPKPIGNIKSYTVKSTPTMGKGVFATRDIPMGGMVFAERPLLVVPTALIASPVVDIDESSLVEYAKVMMFQQEQRLGVAVGRMAPDRRAKLMALMNSHLEDGCGPITGIVRTNGYAVKNLWDGDGEPDEEGALHRRYYSAVCDVGSRINHRFHFFSLFFQLANANFFCFVLFFFSCRPNIDHEFHLSAFAMVFFAIRDVKAGVQLFYSYCSREHSASERKAVLAPYGITQCICAACVNATPETDALRQTFYARVQEYYMQRDSWPLLPKFPVEILNGLLRYRRALVKEGLDTVKIYWSVFLPTLITAYRMADRTNEPEAQLVVQEMMKWLDFFDAKQAMKSSQ